MNDLVGLIYAGGKSRRFGGNKAVALLDGQRLIDHVVARFRPQVTSLAIAGATPVPDASTLTDEIHQGKGPLAGLFAGLKWASSLPNIKWLATTPCDVPLLPTNLVSLLSDNLTDTPRVLSMEGQWQTGCALWPVTARDKIEEILISGSDLSLHSALRSLGAEEDSTEQTSIAGSFLNINTQADLVDLAKLPRERPTPPN